jgi:hypothetical protein
MSYDVVQDMDEVKVALNKFHYIKCCDCALVHGIKFKVVNNKLISFVVYRDERKTAAGRRGFKFIKKIKNGKK